MRIGGWRAGIAACALFGFALVCASRGAPGVPAQQQQESAKEYQQLIRSVEGPDLFRAYCASCHGKDGKGNGPVAPTLKATVPDLTIIAVSNDGNFPVARMKRIIMGEGMITSHGSREMPVWGPIFHQVEEDVDRGNVRVENLIAYLQSIQTDHSRVHATETKPIKKPMEEVGLSGEKLYKQDCAVCHGNDLKGNGPAPPPFMDVPPDLTKLAKSHGGKFPEKYFEDVLRNGVVIPAHGSPEMPTWGADFRTREHLDSTQVTLRITNLSDYIKSLQEK
ncbi:MAG: c-type cytochrome [Candidatus Acidiferrales bacterium]